MALNPELTNLKPINKTLDNIKLRSQKLNNLYNAEKFNECSLNLNLSLIEMRKNLVQLEKSPSLLEKEYFTSDNLIESLNSFQLFKQSLFDLYLDYESYQFQIRANTTLAHPFHDLLNEIHSVESIFQHYILLSSDNRFRTEFTSFWSDFIRPVKNKILPQNDKKLFIHKLNDLNLRLNILNVVLTKRNKKINKQTTAILKTIHRRWNNILKVTLKR
jgi:hypothetical protein